MQTFIETGRKRFGSIIFEDVCEKIFQVKLGFSFLVCGFSEDGEPHIFSVADTGEIAVHDALGFWCIGTGRSPALTSLLLSGYKQYNECERVIYNVLEAKFVADCVTNTVGKSTFLHVTSFTKWRINKDLRLVSRVRKAWEKNGKPKIPDGILKDIRRDIFDSKPKKAI